MNRYILIYIAVIIFIGCKKDPDKGKFYGTASATFNGKTWQSGKVRCIITKQCSNGKLGFQFQVFNQYNELREEMIGMLIIIQACFPLQRL